MRTLVSMRMARWAALGLLLAAGIAGCGASSSRSSGVSPTTARPAVAPPASPDRKGLSTATSTTTGDGSQPSSVQQQRQDACNATGTVENCGAYNLTPGPGSPYFGSQPDAFGNYSIKQGPGASGGDDTPGGGDGG
jgi:hypothetical protein